MTNNFFRPQSPTVTIVIPVFNQEAYICKTIESVLSQTYKNIECIVVDDGCTDGSIEIAKSFGNKISILRQVNQGQAAALNAGWKAAKGEVLGYLSSDDLIDSNAISLLVKKLNEKQSPSVVFSEYRLIDSSGNFIKDVDILFEDYEDMLRTFTCPIGPGALFDRELFYKSGGWNIKLRQIPDFDFWIRIGSYSDFLKIPQKLSSFRVHANSQTFSISDVNKANESIEVAFSLVSSQVIDSSLALEFLASAYCFSSCLHLKSGRFSVGIKRYLQSLKYSPKISFSPETLKRILGSIFSRIKYRNGI